MSKITRREFIKKSAAAAFAGAFFPTIIPATALGKNGVVAPSERIVFGCIGMGGQMRGHRDFYAGSGASQVVAVCDVRKSNREDSKRVVEEISARRSNLQNYKGCDTTEDYQDIIGRDDIDAVVIATPDHWHVQIAIAAAKAGKHVYLEKPMSLTLQEGKLLAQAVRRTGIKLQVGTQQRSEFAFRRAAEIVRNGMIGDIKEIYTDIGVFAQPKILKEEPIPEGFNYEKWLGPSPWYPYNAERVRSFWNGGWRCFWDYGCRKDGDWGAHHYDIIQWALGKDDSFPSLFCPQNTDGSKCRFFEYEKGPRVYINPYDQNGGTKGQMIRFVGTKGEVRVSRGNSLHSDPAGLTKDYLPSGSVRLQQVRSLREDLLSCIRSGATPICNADVGYHTAATCQLSALALRLNRPIKWDTKAEKIIGDADAQAMTSRVRRAPYFLDV